MMENAGAAGREKPAREGPQAMNERILGDQEGTSASREVLDLATTITEATRVAELNANDNAPKSSSAADLSKLRVVARRGALVRELTIFRERSTNEQLDRIGKMSDVAEYAGVGDGSVADMVTGLIGGKASAEADVEMLQTTLDIMTKRAEDAESKAKLNVDNGSKLAELEKSYVRTVERDTKRISELTDERDGLVIKVSSCEQAAGEIIAERDGLRIQLTVQEERIAPLLEAVDILLESGTSRMSSTPVRRQLLTKRLKEFREAKQ